MEHFEACIHITCNAGDQHISDTQLLRRSSKDDASLTDQMIQELMYDVT